MEALQKEALANGANVRATRKVPKECFENCSSWLGTCLPENSVDFVGLCGARTPALREQLVPQAWT
eukprot:3528258-Amphidinium_carterae.1